jgi:hypothetical protein
LVALQSSFGIVVVIVFVGAVLVAVACLLAGRGTWEDYGKGLTMDRNPARGSGAGGGSRGPASEERDEEIRQMLEARNARRARRGESAVDVELELARLTRRPTIDAGLREEIRELVVARNHRRARRGEPPLDIESEVEREITKLGGI